MAVSNSLAFNKEDNELVLTTVTANFDIDRLGDKVKNSRVREGDAETLSDENLAKFFTPTVIGFVDYPSTVVDEHGRIILWYLPDILAPFRVVSGDLVLPIRHD